MVKPGLYPTSAPRHTESYAERAVYDALRRGLPKGWYAWHSLRIRVPRHRDAETDFVIADPTRGLLILEVKGGHIEQRDGRWYTNDFLLKEPPREQANRFLSALLALLRKDGIDPPSCGIATFFPDTAFSTPPGESDVSGCVLGQQDLNRLDKALPDVMACALARRIRPKGRWIQEVHNLWGETWTPGLNLGVASEQRREELLRLDAQQFEILQGLEENRTVLVTGSAGTGKTILVHTIALRLAEAGHKTLLLCFTEALARWLASENPGHPNLTVRAIKRYAVELLEQAGEMIVEQDTPEFWSEVSLRAAVNAVPALHPDWEAVIVDEGQDLTEDDWVLIADLSRGKRLWAFHDPEQAFWPERRVKETLFVTRYRLQKSYRNPREIEHLAGRYLGRQADATILEQGIRAEKIVLKACPSCTSVAAKIALEVNKLLASGLKPGEIAIVSLRGGAEPDSILHSAELRKHEVVPADHPEAGGHIVADTFLRCKGLERPGVIVSDIRLALGKQDYRRRMYIALTRSLSTVHIVDNRDDLLRDPILATVLSACPAGSLRSCDGRVVRREQAED